MKKERSLCSSEAGMKTKQHESCKHTETLQVMWRGTHSWKDTENLLRKITDCPGLKLHPSLQFHFPPTKAVLNKTSFAQTDINPPIGPRHTCSDMSVTRCDIPTYSTPVCSFSVKTCNPKTANLGSLGTGESYHLLDYTITG